MNRAQRGPYKTTEGQYSPVRLELARLVSSLLYGTQVMLVCFLLKRNYDHLNSKGFLRMFLMTRATQKQATTSLKTNSMNINHVEYKQRFKNDLFQNLSQVSSAATC